MSIPDKKYYILDVICFVKFSYVQYLSICVLQCFQFLGFVVIESHLKEIVAVINCLLLEGDRENSETLH